MTVQGAIAMTKQDRFLQVLLRIVGTAGLLAIPFVMVNLCLSRPMQRRRGWSSREAVCRTRGCRD